MTLETIAIVTGAGSGIGRAIAVALAQNGLKVLGVGRRLLPLEETRAFHPDLIHYVSADIATPEGRAQVRRSVPSEIHVRFLIHNAGVLGPVLPFEQMRLEDWRAHFAINLEAPLFLTQLLLPSMNPGSRILHISSGAAHRTYKGWGAYCASKAALFSLYRGLDQELRAYGIRVGSLKPGVVDTPMQAQVRACNPDHFPELQRFLDLKTREELLSPERVAQFVLRMLTECDEEAFAAQEWDIRDPSFHELFR